jgi:hypothetical protein
MMIITHMIILMQHTKVECSWDKGEDEREKVLTNLSQWKHLNESDLRQYIASSDSSDDSDNDDDESDEEYEVNHNNKNSNNSKQNGPKNKGNEMSMDPAAADSLKKSKNNKYAELI